MKDAQVLKALCDQGGRPEVEVFRKASLMERGHFLYILTIRVAEQGKYFDCMITQGSGQQPPCNWQKYTIDGGELLTNKQKFEVRGTLNSSLLLSFHGILIGYEMDPKVINICTFSKLWQEILLKVNPLLILQR